MDEYRIKITVRNNLLLSAIEAAGFDRHGALGKFADECGISRSELSALISFRDRPICRDGTFSHPAKAIMEVLGAAPSDLWTDEQLNMQLVRNTGEMTIGRDRLGELLGEHIENMTLPNPEDVAIQSELEQLCSDVIKSLPEKEAAVLRYRFGHEEMTLEDVAQKFNVGRERIRQIESKALRRIRRCRSTDALRTFVNEDIGDINDD
jgi:RNA polymerase sigma factor (sigma-70 family)